MAVPRDAPWLFDALDESKCRVLIPDTLLFRPDASTGRLSLACWLSTSKSGIVARKSGADAAGHVRRLRDKLVAGASSPTSPVAMAFGNDGIGQGVPPQGLDNLLADLHAGTLEGIIMLQARTLAGPTTGTRRSGGTSPPLISFEVEYSLSASGSADARPVLRARLAAGEAATNVASAALRAAREDLQATAKRVVMGVEAARRVRMLSAVLEFTTSAGGGGGEGKTDGANSSSGALTFVGARAISSSAGPGEAEASTAAHQASAASAVAAAAAALVNRGEGEGESRGPSPGAHLLTAPPSRSTGDQQGSEARLMMAPGQGGGGVTGGGWGPSTITAASEGKEEGGSFRVEAGGGGYESMGGGSHSPDSMAAVMPTPAAFLGGGGGGGGGQASPFFTPLTAFPFGGNNSVELANAFASGLAFPPVPPQTLQQQFPSTASSPNAGATYFAALGTPLAVTDMGSPIRPPGGVSFTGATAAARVARPDDRSTSPSGAQRSTSPQQGRRAVRQAGGGAVSGRPGGASTELVLLSQSDGEEAVPPPHGAASANARAGLAAATSPYNFSRAARGRKPVAAGGSSRGGRSNRAAGLTSPVERGFKSSPEGKIGSGSDGEAAGGKVADENADDVSGNGSRDGTSTTVRRLKAKVATLRAQLTEAQARAAAASAPISDSATLAALRAAGRFTFTEEALPPPEAGRAALVTLVQRMSLRWRDALDLAETVRSTLLREKGDIVARLQEAHRAELRESKSAYDALEEAHAASVQQIEAGSLEFSQAARREALLQDRISRLAAENRRLTTDLQSVLATSSTGAAATNASTAVRGGVAPSRGPAVSVPAAALPSPRRAPGAVPFPSTAAGVKATTSSGGGATRAAAVGILGITPPVANSVSGEDWLLSSSPTGEGVTPSAATLGVPPTAAASTSHPAVAALTLTVRQLQTEVEMLRETNASESAARQELAATASKQANEFQQERRRLKAHVSQLEEAERLRLASALSHAAAEEISNPSLVAATTGSSLSNKQPQAQHLSTLMAKLRESESLQSALASTRAELSAAREDTQAVAQSRMELAARLDGILPVRAALEAELTALRHEVSALRKPTSTTSATSSVSSPGAASSLASPMKSGVDSASANDIASAVTIAAAELASERAAVARQATEAALLRNELRGAQEQLERARGETSKLKDALAALRAGRASEIEALRTSERATREAALQEVTSAVSSSLASAIAMARSELTARYEGELQRLKAEAEKSTKSGAEASEDVARLRAEVAGLSQRLKAAQVAAASAASGVAAAPAPLDGPESPMQLRAALVAASATISALRREVGSVRDASNAQLNELGSAYAGKVASMQAAHGAAVVQAVQWAQAESAAAMARALEADKALRASELDAVRTRGREESERVAMAGEEQRAKLVADAELRFATHVHTLESAFNERLAQATRAAVHTAQAQWEAVTQSALDVLREGGRESAAESAARASAVARREVEAQYSVMLENIASELNSTRAALEEARTLSSSKDEAIAALVNDLRSNTAEAARAQAAAVANATSAGQDALLRAMASRAAEADAAVASAVRAESERWFARLESADRAAKQALEDRISVERVTLTAAHKSELQALTTTHRTAIDTAVREALETVSSVNEENAARLRSLQGAGANERAELVGRFATEIANLQAALQEARASSAASAAALARAQAEANEAALRSRWEHSKTVGELESVVAAMKADQEATASRVTGTFEALKVAAEQEIAAVKRQAAADAVAASQSADQRAVQAVNASVSWARSQWQGELERAVVAAASAARDEYQADLSRLASSADTQVAAQAQAARASEAVWSERLRTVSEANARETTRLKSALDEARSSSEAERRSAEERAAAQGAAADARLAEALRNAAVAAEAHAKELDATLTRGREEAARLTKALAAAGERYEAERAAFSQSASSAGQAILLEAEKLVAEARAEAAREREKALQQLGSEARASIEATAAAATADALASAASERERALASLEARHLTELTDLRALLSAAHEDVAAASARAARAEDAMVGIAASLEQKIMAESEARLRDSEAAWLSRASVLQADNEQAAGIIAGLLKEADEAARRVERLSTDLANLHEQHAREMSLAAGAIEREREAARVAVAAAEARMARATDKWQAERTRLLSATAQTEEGARTAVGQAHAVLAEAAASEALRLAGAFQSEVDALRLAKAAEVAGVEARAAARHEAELAAAMKLAEERATEAVARSVAAATAEADARVGALEQEVTRELGVASRHSAASSAAFLTEMQTRHAAELDAARREAAAALERAQAENAALTAGMEEALSRMRASHEAEILALRDSSLPLNVLTELRTHMEMQAASTIAAAVEEAVAAARAEAQGLQGVLRERIEEADADRRALSSHLDVLQEAVTSQLQQAGEALRAAELRAEQASMVAAEAEQRLAQQRELAEAAAVAAAAAGSTGRPSGSSSPPPPSGPNLAEVEAILQDRAREMARIAEEQSTSWAMSRESLLADLAAARNELASARMAAAGATSEREAALADAAANIAALTAALAHERGTVQEMMRGAMNEALEHERGAFEARAREAISHSVTEAVTAGLADKAAALEALGKKFEAQFAEWEREAERVRATERAALEEAFARRIEALNASALAERDAALAEVQRARAEDLVAAQSQANEALHRAQHEHIAALANLRAAHEEERETLAKAAAGDLSEVLAAARTEMSSLLAATDTAWQERSSGLLAAQAEQNQAALVTVLDAAQIRLDSTITRLENAIAAGEDDRAHLLDRAERALPALAASVRAECEGDKVAALAAFNAEWVARLEARVAELMDARSAELAALKAEYQAHMDSVVGTLEQQRQGALAAFSAEFSAQRESLLAEKAAAIDDTISVERSAASRALAIALQRAEEEKQLVLAEQAEKLAEERAGALAAVRQQATEEQEEAMDALRLESEKLLASIEGAMTKLRDERDTFAEDASIVMVQLNNEKALTARLRDTVNGLRRAGSVSNMRTYVLAGRYVSILAAVRSQDEARRIAELRELDTAWSQRYAACDAVSNEWRRKFHVLVQARHDLATTLTSFKRDLLVQHKVKSTSLAQTLASLAESKAELNRQVQILGNQVGETEGAIRTLEKEMADLSKQSVIDKDGTVNVPLNRRKKRLDRDMDAAIVRMSDRRNALSEIQGRVSENEKERLGKEEELKQVEAGLVGTLVSQQRQLLAVLAAIPLAPEDLELPRDPDHEEQGSGDEDADGGPSGGDGGREPVNTGSGDEGVGQGMFVDRGRRGSTDSMRATAAAATM